MFKTGVDFPLESFGRVLRHIEAHQTASGACPENYSAIGRATGLSHTHVKRLIQRGIAAGSLQRDKAGLVYNRVVWQSVKNGSVRLPVVDVWWSRPIVWHDDGEAVWLDRQLFRLWAPDMWLGRIRRAEPDDFPSGLGLTVGMFLVLSRSAALVAEKSVESLWVVECEDGPTRPMRLIHKRGFVAGDESRDSEHLEINVGSQRSAAKVLCRFTLET